MLSTIPIRLEKVRKEELDKEILRAGIIAELDAINLYEQMANMTENKDIKEVLLEVAREEKTHVGEFQTLLLKRDSQQVEELKKGERHERNNAHLRDVEGPQGSHDGGVCGDRGSFNPGGDHSLHEPWLDDCGQDQ